MDHLEVGRYWNDSADAWTKLARAGYDVYRDYLNTPAFFALLPPIAGLRGLDIGCGEGYNTRLLAQLGAQVWALDLADVFVAYANAAERDEPMGIDYRVASAVALPFFDNSFDFATAFMSLMDVPETDLAVAEAWRVVKPGGFLQFSITHPCFDTPHRRNLRGGDRKTYAIEVGNYFTNLKGEVGYWIFKAAPPELKAGLERFRTPDLRGHSVNGAICSWTRASSSKGCRSHGRAMKLFRRVRQYKTLRWSPTSCIFGSESPKPLLPGPVAR